MSRKYLHPSPNSTNNLQTEDDQYIRSNRSSHPSQIDNVLHLQQTIGNQATMQLMRTETDDAYQVGQTDSTAFTFPKMVPPTTDTSRSHNSYPTKEKPIQRHSNLVMLPKISTVGKNVYQRQLIQRRPHIRNRAFAVSLSRKMVMHYKKYHKHNTISYLYNKAAQEEESYAAREAGEDAKADHHYARAEDYYNQLADYMDNDMGAKKFTWIGFKVSKAEQRRTKECAIFFGSSSVKITDMKDAIEAKVYNKYSDLIEQYNINV